MGSLPPRIRFRPAQEKDARAIRQLIRRVGINPMGLHWQRFLVAVDEQDHLAGCGQIKPHGDDSRELASIAVQPEWQGKGIGQEIIQRLLEHQPLPLYLTCRGSMEPYYWQFGFQAITPEEMPPYFRRIWNLFSIAKKLAPGIPPLRVMRKS